MSIFGLGNWKKNLLHNSIKNFFVQVNKVELIVLILHINCDCLL